MMQRQGRGWASGRGCGGCSGKRGAVQRRGKGKDRDASRKNSRRARQRPRRMNVRAVPAPLRPSTGGRGPAAAVCHRPPCRPRRARSPALSRRPWPGPRPAPPPAAASRAPAPFRPVPPRSPPRAGTAGSCRPPPSRHRHGHRHPCVCPFPGPSPGRHGPPPQRRGWRAVGAVGHTPGPVGTEGLRLRRETPAPAYRRHQPGAAVPR